ncbi:hypothetical protein AGABI2DRAFT_146468 [Agaricus bisporus var. bisporus H97]|uniref:hypothetical protein n=1 Tax=Agaricus bisporus var. bisporus (strain H97 / ATCC MYA-4626 / FGSC 10389) TaxID=936046 RepID=UPI00029F6F80|nr:hypothetical protein AGABI2DRAFT_146468 [Agaricus bisporus var. bisporus H97]EKV42388.1 hypothetical protein AGABI2DRAFT_146468 [Agaricus bisporus var. bisporus H97]
MTSKQTNDAAWSRAKTPASLFTPSVHDSRGPTKDPVRVLTNPWVHKEDEVVAVLQLPPPSSPCDSADNQTFDQKFPFDDSIESLTTLDPNHVPATSHRESNLQQRPLYLFELIILACTLKQAKPEYQILTSNCFWYCAMIFHLVRLRHGLSVHTSRESVPVELQKSRYTLPSISRFINALPMNANHKKTGSESWGWETGRMKSKSATMEGDLGPEYSPTLSPSHLSASADGSSWYAPKLGTWYGIRVLRTPTNRVLRKWLAKMEEAIDWFHSDDLLTHYGHNLGAPTCAVGDDEWDGFYEDSSTFMQSDEDLLSLAGSEVAENWSRNTSLSSLGIGRFDTTLLEANEIVGDDFLDDIWA